MKNKLYTFILLCAVFIFLLVILLFKQQKDVSAPTIDLVPASKSQESSPEGNLKGNDEVLKNALNLYAKKKQEGADFSKGPCLGTIADDWVLDIAHQPRTPEDDKAENQCRIDGKTHHFIELTPEGKIIRLK